MNKHASFPAQELTPKRRLAIPEVFMKKLTSYYRTLLALLTGGSLLAIFLVVFASSLSRYAVNAPLLWSEEFARYAMIYGTMFGASLAYIEGKQIGFNLLTDLLSARARARLELLVHLVTLGVGVVVAYAGYVFFTTRGSLISTGLGIPMAYAQAALSLGGVLLAITALICFLNSVQNIRHGEEC